MKPILFNIEMVKAILDGRKMVTRRVAFEASDLRLFPRKNDPDRWWFRGRVYRNWYDAMHSPQAVLGCCKYRPGDILYVRETWCKVGDDVDRLFFDNDAALYDGMYLYKADGVDLTDIGKWHPSIHMPKEAARLFLRVTDVRIERLQDIDDDGVVAEGMEIGSPFDELWDSTIKKADLPRYGWNANPWVWVIEFERISKEAVEVQRSE